MYSIRRNYGVEVFGEMRFSMVSRLILDGFSIVSRLVVDGVSMKARSRLDEGSMG